jgi:transglutaminase-like putative cysteine protease
MMMKRIGSRTARRVLYAALLIATVARFNAVVAAPQLSDHFHLVYSVHVGGTGTTRVWVPVATTSAFQNVDAKLPPFMSKTTGSYGNTFGFAELAAPADFKVEYDATRQQQNKYVTDAGSVRRWLRGDALVPIDRKTSTMAASIIRRLPANASNSEKARAIYNYVVESMSYDKSGEGWGRGNFAYACATHKGNCTDFHSLFIGLCRAANIPARFVMGLTVPQADSGTIEGYHCWAEFFDPKEGWIPVDASAAKRMGKHDFYFGTLDAERIAFTVGRDLQLQPHQSAGPLNYMIFAYAERAGKPVPVETSITFSR